MPDGHNTLIQIERDTALRNAVIDAALDCIIMMDQDGLVVEFNPAAESIFGYTREEALGEQLADLIIPEHLRTAHHTGLVHYLKSGEHKVLNQRVEVPAVNRAGDELLVELAISPVEFGDSVFFSAYLRDITEARAAQDQLRASEERFQSLFELSPDAVFVIRQDGTIVNANTQAAELIGISKENLKSKHALDLIPEDQHPLAKAGLLQAKAGEVVQIELDFQNAQHVRIPTEVLGKPIETPQGQLFYGVVRDISERIAHEAQLRGAKEAAEKANAAKSDFLANMSHEMRTPLNGVIGSLSLIDRPQVTGEAADLIQSAERAAETLLTLIDDLLDLSRIEAGEVELEAMVFNPQELATIVGEVFTPLAEKKGLTLSTSARLPDSQLKADVGKIRQVLINLVGNAIKFTQRGHVDVSIAYEGTDKTGKLIFDVRDTGIGISKDDQTVLFHRFKQADSSKSKSHGGAGLGLSICKELVEIMDGSIAVSSAPGVGSTFSFSVPVDCWQEQHDTLDSQLSGLTALRGHVLIAEDSETNAMVAKKMLDRLHLTYEHVTDGAAAVDAALNRSFDIVLMDVSMPNLDGLEATRMLRDRGYKTPIIAMTAHALKGDRDNALKMGMSDYLTKPVRPQALRDILGAWLPVADAESPETAHGPTGLDEDAINEIWAGDLETFAQIGEIFLAEMKWRLPELKDAPLSEKEHHAHSLKGAASNIGATELSRLASELEQVARSGQAPRAEKLVSAIEIEATIVCDAITASYISEGING